MRHLDLFSGIGGAALAAEMVWDNVEHVFCEIDPFCQAVLRKHWPNAKIYGDIKELTADTLGQRELQSQRSEQEVGGRTRDSREQPTPDAKRQHEGGALGRSGVEQQDGCQEGKRPETRDRLTDSGKVRVDILTGGFPCQPFSAAGKRRGTEDDRHLWPEMLRVIRETSPRWVIGENVGGFLTWDGGMVFEQVCVDLEAEGYEVCPVVIPACAVNAPHRRDRVWVVAFNPEYARLNGTKNRKSGIEGGDGNSPGSHEDEQLTRPALPRNDVTDGEGAGRKLVAEQQTERQRSGSDRERSEERADWSEDWPSVAARLCTLDDGLPNGLARPRGWRNAALKGAGNAWVPQVAAEIFRGIKEIDAH